MDSAISMKAVGTWLKERGFRKEEGRKVQYLGIGLKTF